MGDDDDDDDAPCCVWPCGRDEMEDALGVARSRRRTSNGGQLKGWWEQDLPTTALCAEFSQTPFATAVQ